MSEAVKTKLMKVIPICSVCGKPVNTVGENKSPRHGFKRHKLSMTSPTKKFSQEDGIPCDGSGKEVVYKSAKRYEGKVK
jgi:hypothetical protein